MQGSWEQERPRHGLKLAQVWGHAVLVWMTPGPRLWEDMAEGPHLLLISSGRSLGPGVTITRAPGGPGRGPELQGTHGGSGRDLIPLVSGWPAPPGVDLGHTPLCSHNFEPSWGLPLPSPGPGLSHHKPGHPRQPPRVL